MTDKQIGLNSQKFDYFKAKSKIKRRNYQKNSRNLQRRNRRKRSKFTYYTKLKEIRIKKKREELCSEISVFDMDWASINHSTNIQTQFLNEVNDWHKHEQIAYWKSRALSLELENRMLHEHVRNIYAKQIQDYSDYMKEKEEKSTKPINNVREESKEGSKSKIEPVGKKRREEMFKLYGEKAPKIMGMETAVQLNYDRIEASLEPLFWPIVPLNLKYD